jgi:hypothetical protein
MPLNAKDTHNTVPNRIRAKLLQDDYIFNMCCPAIMELLYGLLKRFNLLIVPHYYFHFWKSAASSFMKAPRQRRRGEMNELFFKQEPILHLLRKYFCDKPCQCKQEAELPEKNNGIFQRHGRKSHY